MRNPYVGLRPFFTDDSLYFFGRDAQVAEVLDLLKRSRFVSVVGSSGSGKSSLIRAGLIPSLLGGFLVSDRDQWRVASIRPGSAPLRNLAGEVRRAMGDADDPAAEDALRARLLDGGVDEAAELLAALGPHENYSSSPTSSRRSSRFADRRATRRRPASIRSFGAKSWRGVRKQPRTSTSCSSCHKATSPCMSC
jgi:energy-coupling factor transporter ATP-binding protein EcfA2